MSMFDFSRHKENGLQFLNDKERGKEGKAIKVSRFTG